MRAGWVVLILALLVAGGGLRGQDLPSSDTGEVDRQVGPYAQCLWDYENGLEPFRNSARDPAVDPSFDPHITVSRRGLTARVVGVLSDETMARFGGSVAKVVAAYPYLTPVRYVAIHTVRPEDLTRKAAWRAANPAGEVVRTEVREWPANAVMIIYPVSVAAPGYNTAAGNWQILTKTRSKPNNKIGNFGRFPFLAYTTEGHALHGPITGNSQSALWGLRRGNVSHGCNRMEGEHVVELSALLGCPSRAATGSCGSPNEAVVVMDEFDHFPNPGLSRHAPGAVLDFGVIATSWVSPDIRNFPRDRSSPLPESWRVRYDDGAGVVLGRTRNKTWVTGSPRDSANSTSGMVRQTLFDTWDNRVTSRQAAQRPVVVGRACDLD